MAVEQTPKPKASALGYLVGALLMIGGIAYGGYLAGQAVMGGWEKFTKGELNLLQKVGVAVPVTDRTVALPQPGEYTVWVALHGKEELSTDDPQLQQLARTVHIAVKPSDSSKSVSMSPVSGERSYRMGNQVGFGIFSLDSGDANTVVMTTGLNTDKLSEPLSSAMDRVEKVQIVVARVDDGGLMESLGFAGGLAGVGIALGLVVIVVTGIRRSAGS